MKPMNKPELDSLITINYKYIYKNALDITHDRNLAHDLLNDAIVRAYKNIDKYDSNKGKFKDWMFIMMRNMYFNMQRIKKYFVDIDDVSYLCEEKFNAEPEPIITDEVLMQTVRKLNPRRRLVFEKLMENKSQAEMAKELGITVSGIKRRVRTMRDELHTLLKDYEGEL